MTEAQGNIVAEYRVQGATVLISDAAYAGKSAWEIAADIENCRRAAWAILDNTEEGQI